jgi:cell wall-associated NlpC family hydrolase
LATIQQSSAAIPAKGFAAHPAPASNPAAKTAVEAALSQLGKPYVWGAAGPDSFDCSGLTMWAWAKAGVTLSHFSAAQYAETQRVETKDLQPGDLVFYYHPIEHVAMYIGNGQMVEAPHTGAFVRAVPLRTGDFSGAGRPTPPKG